MFICAVKVNDCSKICFANDCDDDCFFSDAVMFDADIDIIDVNKLF